MRRGLHSPNTYSDSAGTIPNTNPIILDGSGRLDVDVYLGSMANYKEVLTTAIATVSPWPDDNIPLASQADWNATSGPNQIINKPTLAAVATSGSYTDLSNTPVTNAVFAGDRGSGGTSGLVPAPAAGDAVANMFLSAAGGWATPPGSSSSSATNLSITETVSSVSIGSSSGTGVIIPAATSAAAGVLDSTRAAKIDGLATVATSGSYTDLANKPSIPSIPSSLSGQNIDNVARLGINTADTGNALSVNAPSILFSNGGDMRTTISKGASSNTAAINFQDNFSTRAQFGLLGNDSFTISTSPDGSAFENAIVATTAGAVSFPNTGGFTGDSGSGGGSGLVPAPAAGTAAAGMFLKADGTWSVPPGTASAMTGASASAEGAAGFVPAPSSGQQGSFLRGDGTWQQMTAGQVSGLAASATTDATNAANIASGTLPAARLPNPGPSALGGVASATAPSNQFMTGIGTSGIPQFAQPSASNISGLAASAIADTTNAGNITSGTLAAVRIADLSATYIATSQLGANSGVATLDSSGKLTSGQIPASLTGAVVYQGVWNASTNSPTLVNGTGTKGNYYKVSAAGSTTIDGISQWAVGDTIIFDGSAWDKIDGNSPEVLSVAGLSGAITAPGLKSALSIGAGDISGLAASATTDATNAANIGSGTLPAARLPNPSGSALGGVQSGAAGTNQFMAGISTSGVPQFAQPSSANISGLGSLATVTPGTGVATALGNALNGSGGLVSYSGTIGAATGTSLTLGTQQTMQGSLVLANTASGAYATTLQSSNSATASSALTLPPAPPTANGQVLSATTGGVMSWVTPSSGGLTIGSTPLASGTFGDILYDNGGVLGQLATTGSAGNVVLSTSPTVTNLTLAAGSTTVAPLVMTSGTNLTAPSAGAHEYDGQALYFSPVANVRGVIPAYQHSHVTASGGVSLSNVNTAQSFLPSGAQNFPVQAGVIYRFRARVWLNVATTNSCTASFLFATGGGAAFSWVAGLVVSEFGTSANGGGAQYVWEFASSSGYAISTTGKNSYVHAVIEGEIVMSSGGTIQPQIQFSAGAGDGKRLHAGLLFRTLHLWSQCGIRGAVVIALARWRRAGARSLPYRHA